MDRVADFSVGDIVKVHNRQVEEFPAIARENTEKKRYRLCLHDNPNNRLQEMMICMVRGDYARPHKHHDMPESHMILAGKAAIVLFSDTGEIVDAFLFDKENGYLSYRINADVYHMTVLLSDTVIEYEVKPGPFDPANNIFPSWAPDGEDKVEAARFIAQIEQSIKKRWVQKD